MKLSREKRLRFGIWNDYFVSGSLVDGDWKMREGYTEEKINNFFQSTKYRTYLDEKFYPKYKKDQCDWFSGKYYYPETYKKNPMLDGEWFVKPTRGTNGDGVILTKDLTKVNVRDAIYQRHIKNPLLYNGRKQDFRFFVVLQIYGGYLRTFIYPEAFIRLSFKPFDNSAWDEKIHLTNYEFYVKESFKSREKGLLKFSEYEHRDLFYKKFVKIMQDFSQEVFNRMNGYNQRNLIHVFGLDMIPDEDFNLWLLEINECPGPTSGAIPRLPSFFKSYPLDFMHSVFDELLIPMKSDTYIRTNNFDLIYEKELKYNKWIFV